MTKLPGCRRSAFEALDAPALKPLPVHPLVLAQFKPARVNIDYHVELDGHYYSVPHRLVRAEVELRITGATVAVLAGQQRVAAHALSAIKGAHTTVAEHMPASHRAHLEWTPAKLIAWGERIGAATGAGRVHRGNSAATDRVKPRACANGKVARRRFNRPAMTAVWPRHRKSGRSVPTLKRHRPVRTRRPEAAGRICTQACIGAPWRRAHAGRQQ